jgi:hypothetical protein
MTAEASGGRLRFGFADPPYFQCARKHYGDHPESGVYDTVEGHQHLVRQLVTDFPDGWALCMRSVDLLRLLPAVAPILPADTRVASWVKPFAVFKVHVNPAYTWEPVLFRGGRTGDRTRLTVRDHLAAPIAMRRGVVGAKPDQFNRWILDLLGWRPGDTVTDLFPGTGSFARVVARAEQELPLTRGVDPLPCVHPHVGELS